MRRARPAAVALFLLVGLILAGITGRPSDAAPCPHRGGAAPVLAAEPLAAAAVRSSAPAAAWVEAAPIEEPAGGSREADRCAWGSCVLHCSAALPVGLAEAVGPPAVRTRSFDRGPRPREVRAAGPWRPPPLHLVH